MNNFPLPLKVTPDSESHLWTLDAPFDYHSQYGYVTCETGFTTDFATIPPVNVIGGLVVVLGSVMGWTWLFILGMVLVFISHTLLHTGSYTRAAVIHDKLYSNREFTRRQSDNVLYEAMEDCGTPFWKRSLIWANVRMVGWLFWRKQRRQALLKRAARKTLKV